MTFVVDSRCLDDQESNDQEPPCSQERGGCPEATTIQLVSAREFDERRHLDDRLTRPHRPQTSGKVERFNRTLAREGADVRDSEAVRSASYNAIIITGPHRHRSGASKHVHSVTWKRASGAIQWSTGGFARSTISWKNGAIFRVTLQSTTRKLSSASLWSSSHCAS